MSYINQAKLANDPTFRLIVELGMVRAATQVASEAVGGQSTTVHAKRAVLAHAVLNDPTQFVDQFAWAVAQNEAVVTSSPVSVTASTGVNPSVVTTAAAHGLTTGNTVLIAGHGGNTVLNAAWTVTVILVTTFSVPVLGTAAGTGGTVTRYPIDSDVQFTINSVWNGIAGVRSTD